MEQDVDFDDRPPVPTEKDDDPREPDELELQSDRELHARLLRERVI